MNPAIPYWLNSQHAWVQEAAHRLLTNGAIKDGDIADFIAIIKAPVADPKDSKPCERTYPEFGPGGEGSPCLRLTSIGEIVGIDNLAPKTPLAFPAGNLIVVYGNNGSGKSGYARILKKACGKAGSPDLKPNVFKAKPAQMQCKISFEAAGIVTSCQWTANSAPIPELSAVDIFDSTSGRVYLESETEVAFSPPDLVFFSDLTQIYKRVEASLEAEIAGLPSALPQLPTIHSATKVGTQYSALAASAKTADLLPLFPWTTEDEDKLKTFTAKKAVTDPQAEAKKRRAVKLQRDNIRARLEGARKAVTKAACDEVSTLIHSAIAARTIATQGVAAVTQSARLEGVGTPTWMELWRAAKEYSTTLAYPGIPSPNIEEGAKCVLCQQDLDEDARQRLGDFEGYVTGTLETAARATEKLAQEALDALPPIPDAETLTPICQAAELPDALTDQISAAWEEIRQIVELLRRVPLPAEIKGLDVIDCPVLAQLLNLSEAAEQAAQNFDQDALTFDGKKTTEDIQELEAKKWTATQKEAIEAEVTRLKRIAKLNAWVRLTSTTGLSRKAGELSEVLITDAYVARFNAELKKLGAVRVQVELVKSRVQQGHVKHKIQLKGLAAQRLGEILSEGENRIVILAAFLATVTAKPDIAPFVFDDPISSLDQDFEEKTVDRLVELSKDRQVIVFTHRLSLLGLISEKVTPEIVTIKHESWGSGQPTEVPIFAKKPENVLKNLKNSRVMQAKKVLETEGSDAYYPLAKSLCSDIRILIERLVELVLLGDVVQRHRRAVNTLGKIHLLAKIIASDCNLVDRFMTRYSAFEHSQSLEAPVELPNPSEFETDIDELLKWHDEFKART